MSSLRAETAALVRLADRDLKAMWRAIHAGADTKEVLNDLLPALVVEYGAMGAAMAADWYDVQRDESDARGSWSAVPIEADDRGAGALIGWALLTATDDAGLAGLIGGGIQRRIADHARETVTANSVQDPGARGWLRVSSGSACAWCEQYIDGEVRMVSGYDFPAHDNCNCSVVPSF